MIAILITAVALTAIVILIDTVVNKNEQEAKEFESRIKEPDQYF